MHSTNRKLVGFGIVALSALLSSGCMMMIPRPIEPTPRLALQPPATRYQSLEAVINTPVVLNFNKPTQKDSKNTTIAVMPLGGVVPVAGTFVADSLLIAFSRKNFKIVERENIETVMRERQIVEQSRDLTEEKKARLIGRIVKADYMVLGAVTEYNSQNQMVPLCRFIPRPELDRYAAEYYHYEKAYATYMEQYNQYLKDVRDYNIKAEILGGREKGQYVIKPGPPSEKPKSLEEWQREVESAPCKQELGTMANIGLTARIIDVKTGEIVWVGQASKRHTQLQEGLQILTSELVDSFVR